MKNRLGLVAGAGLVVAIVAAGLWLYYPSKPQPMKSEPAKSEPMQAKPETPPAKAETAPAKSEPAPPAKAEPAMAKIDAATVDRYIQSTFGKVPAPWKERVVQDETQRICTLYRNDPPAAERDKIQAREAATVVYPADDKVIGDWKAGEKVAQSGRGGQFTDKPDTVSGGNCYACHQLAKAEVSFGTLGPPLANYGRERKFDPAEAKMAYAKLFNSNAAFPCSNMPRFGYHKVLTEQQMKDVVAYLFDPASPVNQ